MFPAQQPHPAHGGRSSDTAAHPRPPPPALTATATASAHSPVVLISWTTSSTTTTTSLAGLRGFVVTRTRVRRGAGGETKELVSPAEAWRRFHFLDFSAPDDDGDDQGQASKDDGNEDDLVYTITTVGTTTPLRAEARVPALSKRKRAASPSKVAFHSNRGFARAGMDDPTTPEAQAWLSMGLRESAVALVDKAKQLVIWCTAATPNVKLLIAAYEFSDPEFADALQGAAALGVDVRIVYHFKPTEPRACEARDAIAARKLNGTPRTKMGAGISHNKFIVLVENGTPTTVWTGSCNFSRGGFLGQWNVAMTIHDEAVARAYGEYWSRLQADVPTRALADELQGIDVKAFQHQSPKPSDVGGGSISVRPFFSPRAATAVNATIEFLAGLIANARHLVAIPVAFTFPKRLLQVLCDESTSTTQRLLLVEKQLPSADVAALRADPRNRVVAGAVFHGEKLTGLNEHVRFVHAKLLLVDPLGPNPIVVHGSANLGAASVSRNDENVVVVRGDHELAKAAFLEFFRVFRRFEPRSNAVEAASSLRSPQARQARPARGASSEWWRPFWDEREALFHERVALAPDTLRALWATPVVEPAPPPTTPPSHALRPLTSPLLTVTSPLTRSNPGSEDHHRRRGRGKIIVETTPNPARLTMRLSGWSNRAEFDAAMAAFKRLVPGCVFNAATKRWVVPVDNPVAARGLRTFQEEWGEDEELLEAFTRLAVTVRSPQQYL